MENLEEELSAESGLLSGGPLSNESASSPLSSVSKNSQLPTQINTAERVESLAIEEQEILANIQELQLQLMKLKVEKEEHAVEEDTSSVAYLNSEDTFLSNRLLVISNTLPITLERSPLTGRWTASRSTCGLDKFLCLKVLNARVRVMWIGWVGQYIPKFEQEYVARLLFHFDCIPVFLEKEHNDKFSSGVLWSLFHYVPEISEPAIFATSKNFDVEDWNNYKIANETFAELISDIYQENDNIWIHDHHLMLLPGLLRDKIFNQKKLKARIGWFLHTPFPCSDVYRRLPVRRELLNGLLQADLVGFQTYDYARHFLSTCERVLNVDSSPNGVFDAERSHFMYLGVYPIGINVEHFKRVTSKAATKSKVTEFRKRFEDKKIILGVDRLDNIKGIPHKLLSMENLYNRYPEWTNKAILLQIGMLNTSFNVNTNKQYKNRRLSAAPNRTNANSNQRIRNDKTNINSRNNSAASQTLKKPKPKQHPSPSNVVDLSGSPSKISNANMTSNVNAIAASTPIKATSSTGSHSAAINDYMSQVNHLVGRINANFGTFDSQPIHFINQLTIDQEDLCALYEIADVCLVTSIRDGMNLVSHEFVVCQNNQQESEENEKGVLVLSEFAGCAQSLSGALLINPWNTEDVASSINTALGMSSVEKELRHQKLHRYVCNNNATHWANFFLTDLNNAAEKNQNKHSHLARLSDREVRSAYEKSQNRVIISDYDVTPLTQQNFPSSASSSNLQVVLDNLGQDERNTVFIVSSRERSFLHTHLKDLRIGVAAEDGFYYRMNMKNETDEKWKSLSDTTRNTTSSIPQMKQSKSMANIIKELVMPTMKAFTECTPGSYIEDKESSLTWHYRDADVHFGSWQAKDLQITLERFLTGTDYEAHHGSGFVEVKHEGCSKFKVLEGLLKLLSTPKQIKKRGGKIDFIFCVGDDSSDGQMFEMLDKLNASKDLEKDPKRSLSKTLVPEEMMVDEDKDLAEKSEEETVDFNKLDHINIDIAPDCKIFSIHVGNEDHLSQANYCVHTIGYLRRILRGFAEVSRKKLILSQSDL